MKKHLIKLVWSVATSAVIGTAGLLFTMNARLTRVETKMDMLLASRPAIDPKLAKLP